MASMLDSSVDEYNLLVACVYLTYTMQVTTFPTELRYKHMCYSLSPVMGVGDEYPGNRRKQELP